MLCNKFFLICLFLALNCVSLLHTGPGVICNYRNDKVSEGECCYKAVFCLTVGINVSAAVTQNSSTPSDQSESKGQRDATTFNMALNWTHDQGYCLG